ncbi:uncharacterized protein [Clytia hemisphaerica]|uniref:uncharacterized protein n=1 Tax=Clytia hemisphaerica TaxID=252671 RepID=UPI0034D5E0CE
MDSTKALSFCLFVFMVIAQNHAKKYVKKSFTIANYNEDFCADKIEGCQNLRNRCNLKLVQRKCKSTCGLCVPSPPLHCGLTKYGCCWDNQTRANSSNKDGCPPCADKHSMCRFFKSECSARPDVRLVCPITCGIPCDRCRDSEHQKLVCPMYKEVGFCKISPDLMRQICARTCNFCPI